MQVTLNYFGQLRQFADKESDSRQYAQGTPLLDVLQDVAGVYGEGFGAILFDASGELRPSVMVLVNDVPVNKHQLPTLEEDDNVSLFAAIAGG